MEEEPNLVRTPDRSSSPFRDGVPYPPTVPPERETTPSRVRVILSQEDAALPETLERGNRPPRQSDNRSPNPKRKRQQPNVTRGRDKPPLRRNRPLQNSSGPSTGTSTHNDGRRKPHAHNSRSRTRKRSAPDRRRSRSRRYKPRTTRSLSKHSNSTEHEYRPSRDEKVFIEDLVRDLSAVITDRSDFARFSKGSVRLAATILVRFGIETLAELRSTRSDQRSHFLADAKKSYGSKSMKLVHEIFATFPPVKKGRNIATVEFNEIHLPRRLKNFTVDLSTIAGTLRPTQEMVNAVSEEIARGESNPQPFHPYVIPNYHEHPWLPRNAPHVNAFHAWKNKSKGVRKNAISFQQWLHHHMRFVFSAEVCSLWTPFGGIAAQLNHITVLLSLATLESAGFAMKYHDLLVRTLADCARARFPFDYATALSEVHEDTRRAILVENARMAPTPQAHYPPRSSKENNRPKGIKSRNNAPKGTNAPNKGKGRKRFNDTTTRAGKGPTPMPTSATPLAAQPKAATG